MKTSKQQNSGFSLIEVLVSVVVLSVGLLGLAGLQTNVIKFNHSAYLRSIAIYQTENIIDRMRSNKKGVEANAYIVGIAKKESNIKSNCNPCSATEIAEQDILTWNQSNNQLLPNGQGTIQTNGDLYIVTIMWDNDRNGVTGTNCSGNSSVDLTCLQMDMDI